MVQRTSSIRALVLECLLLFVVSRTVAEDPGNKTTTEPQRIVVASHRPIWMKTDNETLAKFVERMLKGYESYHRPDGETSNGELSRHEPVRVKINMNIVSFGGVSVLSMDYTVDLLLRQRWFEPRLRFINTEENRLSLSYMKEKLWIPDLFFRNAKEGQLHKLTTPNNLIWLNKNGHILFSQKLSVRLACPMDLWYFPLDTQTCPLEMGSYGYGTQDLVFEWLHASNASENVVFEEKLELNEFHRPHVHTSACQKSYKSTGQFTCILAKFTMRRKFAFYLIYTYLPSTLIVIISWVSFFIDFKAAPARISLCLLSVLALITQSVAPLQQLARVSYIKALDIWLFVCLAFVVFSLIEYAVVNVLARREERANANQRMRDMFHEELKTVLQVPLALTSTEGKPDAANPPPTGPSSKAVTLEEICNPDELFATLIQQPAEATSSNAAQQVTSTQDTTVVVRRNKNLNRNNATLRELMGPTASRQRQRNNDLPLKAQEVDHFCLIVFPALFVMFNICYWSYFLAGSHVDIQPPH